MSQNLLSLSLTDADYADIDATLAVLERHAATLVNLSTANRHSLNKMGDKSEAFCRQALRVLGQNRHVLPPPLDLAEEQRDLAQFDLLCTRTFRLEVLMGKIDNTLTALGGDVMNASLEGYALLRSVGEGSGPGTLRQSMGTRFARRSAKPKEDASDASAVARIMR